ncbi:flavin reductase family protein [Leeia aquatica]|uniref:Flavin reductase family protein n=1 Tax=Leeia aquatica TaxID=2725557 RepID=A0A847S4Y2_9NEIS|nr:flavin reductase family protein [Leeia aquatica]NLR74843.1 flavin reductase family protein [Leeia aquatica]
MDQAARVTIPLDKSWRLLNHGPTVLVSSASGDRRNVMSAAWSMPLDFSPPKIAIVIDKATLTRELVEASGEFALCIPPRTLAASVVWAGQHSGRDVQGDKFAHAGLRTFPASRIGAPLIEDCLGWLECKVISEPDVQGKYDLFLAEVVSAQADARIFQDGHWQQDAMSPRSIHYIAGGLFFETGEMFDTTPR